MKTFTKIDTIYWHRRILGLFGNNLGGSLGNSWLVPGLLLLFGQELVGLLDANMDGRWDSGLRVSSYPVNVYRSGPRAGEKAFECFNNRQETNAALRRDNAIVPLDAFSQCLPAQVGTSYVGNTATTWFQENVCLGMKACASGFKDPQIKLALCAGT